MPLTSLAEIKIAASVFGGVAVGPPATIYAGLVIAGTWTAGMTGTSGTTYVTGTAFTTTNRHIFKCTTSGTAGGSEPAWNQGNGATTSDGSVVWTEVTILFGAGTFTNAEPSGNNYSRVTMTNNQTNFPAPTGNSPATGTNGVAITWPQSSGAWGSAAGILWSDAASAGNYWSWGLMAALLPVSTSGITPSLPIGQFSWTAQ